VLKAVNVEGESSPIFSQANTALDKFRVVRFDKSNPENVELADTSVFSVAHFEVPKSNTNNELNLQPLNKPEPVDPLELFKKVKFPKSIFKISQE
jgi:hypothetical protein